MLMLRFLIISSFVLYNHITSAFIQSRSWISIFSTFKLAVPFNTESSELPPQKGPIGSIVDTNSSFQWVSVRLTAKCGSKSTQSVPPKPEISSALGRWSTTACTGKPLPRPLEPLPRALRAPRPRVWTPRPRPGERIPLLAAWANKNRDEKKSNRAPITTRDQRG